MIVASLNLSRIFRLASIPINKAPVPLFDHDCNLLAELMLAMDVEAAEYVASMMYRVT